MTIYHFGILFSQFLKFIYFNWRLIAFQYCGGFCHTLTWISHRCTCAPCPEPLYHLLPHPIPLGFPSAPALSALFHALNLNWSSISHMVIYISQIILPLPCPKKTYRWLTNTWKDSHHHSLSEKCKWKPQWCTISEWSEWLPSKILQTINAGEGVEKREPSYTVGGNEN